ncbi:MAG TPA: two-component regulator propeller domain-containing protein, partial [Burkholderiales bacterium]|nr:two-component regulator propeller domain-containing protein [Burkholderiales bacterium]
MTRRVLALLAASLALAGPAFAQTKPAAPPAAPGSERVLETYQVGENVYVRALTVQQTANVMWVGTSVGVHAIDLKTLAPKSTFTRDQGLANEYVFAVGIDSQDHVWFGTNAGGASRYRDGKWKTYFPMHGLADYWIYAFANQKDGTLWIGTWAGTSKVDPKTGKFTTYVRELINEWVYGLGVDAKDRVWFGTEG